MIIESRIRNRCKVVFDTNILISAIVYPKGKTSTLFDLVNSGKLQLYISTAILRETRRVLKEKFKYSKAMIDKTVMYIREHAVLVRSMRKINVIEQDDDDNRIVECALTAKADYIISGDHHLLKLKSYKGINILKASEFLEIMDSGWNV